MKRTYIRGTPVSMYAMGVCALLVAWLSGATSWCACACWLGCTTWPPRHVFRVVCLALSAGWLRVCVYTCACHGQAYTYSYVIHRQMNMCLDPCICMCISPGAFPPVSEKLQPPSRIDQVLVLVNWGRDCNPMRRFWSPGVHLELPVDAVLVGADQN